MNEKYENTHEKRGRKKPLAASSFFRVPRTANPSTLSEANDMSRYSAHTTTHTINTTTRTPSRTHTRSYRVLVLLHAHARTLPSHTQRDRFITACDRIYVYTNAYVRSARIHSHTNIVRAQLTQTRRDSQRIGARRHTDTVLFFGSRIRFSRSRRTNTSSQ